MKKVMWIAAIASSLAMSAMAYEVIWDTGYGVFANSSPSVSVDDDYVGIAQDTSVLWQLIRAGGTEPAPVDLTRDHYVGEGDTWIDERIITKGGNDIFDDCLYLREGVSQSDNCKTPVDYTWDTADPYYIYQRVFEGTTPAEGMYYYESAPVLLNDGGAQTLFVDVAGGGDVGVKANLIVQGSGNVPEPATMSLLGLGALAMVLRRKLRK